MTSSPDMKKQEELLRMSRIVAGRFLGNDPRPLDDIIEYDLAELAKLNRTVQEIADRMSHIAALAETGLGSWVSIDKNLEAAATDTRGVLPCPWPHQGVFPKTVVTLRNKHTGKTLSWSALNVHLIAEHSFFEGRGAQFRLEPNTLTDFLF